MFVSQYIACSKFSLPMFMKYTPAEAGQILLGRPWLKISVTRSGRHTTYVFKHDGKKMVYNPSKPRVKASNEFYAPGWNHASFMCPHFEAVWIRKYGTHSCLCLSNQVKSQPTVEPKLSFKVRFILSSGSYIYKVIWWSSTYEWRVSQLVPLLILPYYRMNPDEYLK